MKAGKLTREEFLQHVLEVCDSFSTEDFAGGLQEAFAMFEYDREYGTLMIEMVEASARLHARACSLRDGLSVTALNREGDSEC
jgi:hypothetical protein